MASRKWDRWPVLAAVSLVLLVAIGAVSQHHGFVATAETEVVCGHFNCWEDVGGSPSRIYGIGQLGFEGTTGMLAEPMEMHANFIGSGALGETCAALVSAVEQKAKQLGCTPGPRQTHFGTAYAYQGFAFVARGPRSAMMEVIGGLGDEVMASAANLPGDGLSVAVRIEEEDPATRRWLGETTRSATGADLGR